MSQPEVWLRGPLPGIPPLLQPVAHALLQVREELNILMAGFPDELLWQTIAGVASPGFHLKHLTGVLDRLFTYAYGGLLNAEQLTYLAAEGKPDGQNNTITHLVDLFNGQIDHCLKKLSAINEQTLTDVRNVGRARLPSTVIGLLVHAAEHTTRHYGQLLVTVNVLKTQQ